MEFHFYADDTQLYISFSASNDLELTSSIAKIEEWISDLDKWMSLIKLKLNKDKTELLYLYSKYSPQQSLPPLSFGSDTIQPSPCSRNIGVVFDRTMSMLPRYFNRVTFLRLEPSIKNVSIRTNTEIPSFLQCGRKLLTEFEVHQLYHWKLHYHLHIAPLWCIFW